MAALDENHSPETWAEKLAMHLQRQADYIDQSAGQLSNVELQHIESLTNAITRILSDHEERTAK